MKRLVTLAVLIFGATAVSAAAKETVYKLSPWATLLLTGIIIVVVLMVRSAFIAKQRLDEEDAERRRRQSAENAADKIIEEEWDEPELVGTPDTPEIVVSSDESEEDAIPISDSARHLEG